MLAAGHLDLVVETELKPYDIAALIPIITGAGGIVTTWEGKPAQGGGRIIAAGDAARARGGDEAAERLGLLDGRACLSSTCRSGLLNGEPKHDLRWRHTNASTGLPQGSANSSGSVIFIQHCGAAGDDFEPHTPGWALLPELQREASDLVVRKELNDPFAGTDLQARLQEISPERVLVTGWATDLCVDATVRSAVANDHHVDCGHGRPYAERSPSSGRYTGHSTSQLGVERAHHATIHQGRRHA